MKPLLTSPLRKSYLKDKHEIKGCPFCSLDENQLIKKGVEAALIINKYPYMTGHLLIIPLAHKESLEELSPSELSESMNLVRSSVNALKEVYKPAGFNVGINWGSNAGGSLKHFHIHVVPRFNNDTQFFHTTDNTSIILDSLEETKEKLAKHFK